VYYDLTCYLINRCKIKGHADLMVTQITLDNTSIGRAVLHVIDLADIEKIVKKNNLAYKWVPKGEQHVVALRYASKMCHGYR